MDKDGDIFTIEVARLIKNIMYEFSILIFNVIIVPSISIFIENKFSHYVKFTWKLPTDTRRYTYVKNVIYHC